MVLIMEINNEYQRYQQARKQVEKIKGFYVHFATFIIIMVLLVYINLKYTPEYLWFFWSLFGWGIGVFFHALFTFRWFSLQEWEKRKINEFMEQERTKEN
jgi:hypothetical protein